MTNLGTRRLQIIGRRLDDALVLRAFAAFEAAAPWAARSPPRLTRRADLIELHARDHAVAIPGTITRSDKPSFGPT
jgi:hypothetical protein